MNDLLLDEFEILLINGLIVCIGLLLIKKDNVSLIK